MGVLVIYMAAGNAKGSHVAARAVWENTHDDIGGIGGGIGGIGRYWRYRRYRAV